MQLGPFDQQLLDVAEGKFTKLENDLATELVQKFQDLKIEPQKPECREESFVICAGLLIDKGANINCQDPDNETPLIKAASQGNLKFVQLLLSKGANLGLDQGRSQTALHAACSSNALNVSMWLLNKNPLILTHQDKRKCLALHYAIHNPLLVAKLLDLGSPVDAQCLFGDTALHYAVKCGAPRQTLVTLLDHGADYSLKNDDGQTALSAAVQLNAYPELIGLLLEKDTALQLKAKELSLAAKLQFLLGSCRYSKYSPMQPVTILPVEICQEICLLVNYRDFQKQAFENLKVQQLQKASATLPNLNDIKKAAFSFQ